MWWIHRSYYMVPPRVWRPVGRDHCLAKRSTPSSHGLRGVWHIWEQGAASAPADLQFSLTEQSDKGFLTRKKNKRESASVKGLRGAEYSWLCFRPPPKKGRILYFRLSSFDCSISAHQEAWLQLWVGLACWSPPGWQDHANQKENQTAAFGPLCGSPSPGD